MLRKRSFIFIVIILFQLKYVQKIVQKDRASNIKFYTFNLKLTSLITI